MLGHEPQSWEFSTLGGWVATRSVGPALARVRADRGALRRRSARDRRPARSSCRRTRPRPPVPTSASSSSARRVGSGSSPRRRSGACRCPTIEKTIAIFLPDWERGMVTVRDLAAARLPLAMIRLSTPLETRTTLALAGHERRLAAAGPLARRARRGRGQCLLLLGVAGRTRIAEATAGEASKLSKKHGGVAGAGSVRPATGSARGSARRTCGTRCGRWLRGRHGRDRDRLVAGARAGGRARSRPWRPVSKASTSGSTPSPTCPTSTVGDEHLRHLRLPAGRPDPRGRSGAGWP